MPLFELRLNELAQLVVREHQCGLQRLVGFRRSIVGFEPVDDGSLLICMPIGTHLQNNCKQIGGFETAEPTGHGCRLAEHTIGDLNTSNVIGQTSSSGT